MVHTLDNFRDFCELTVGTGVAGGKSQVGQFAESSSKESNLLPEFGLAGISADIFTSQGNLHVRPLTNLCGEWSHEPGTSPCLPQGVTTNFQ